MTKESENDMMTAAFINGRIPIHKRVPAFSGFVADNDFSLFGQGNLGIGNHGGKKKCMGMVTAGTNHTADAERDFAVRIFEKTGIVSVNGQTA